jgi:hypothetical protein
LPDRPLFSVPALRFFMARPTFFAAPFEYLRFLAFFTILPVLAVQQFARDTRQCRHPARFVFRPAANGGRAF